MKDAIKLSWEASWGWKRECVAALIMWLALALIFWSQGEKIDLAWLLYLIPCLFLGIIFPWCLTMITGVPTNPRWKPSSENKPEQAKNMFRPMRATGSFERDGKTYIIADNGRYYEMGTKAVKGEGGVWFFSAEADDGRIG